MPEAGMIWLDKRQVLTYEEIARLVRIFAGLGVNKVRLTGGEPLMRKDLHVLVGMIAHIHGITDIALTTNGFFLAEQAAGLAAAGLHRINVSMDSIDPSAFSVMTRRDYLRKVWEGLDALEGLPRRADGRPAFHPVKINVVTIRGINDGEIGEFVRLARTGRFIIRFIEFMPIGADDGWSIEKVVPTHEIIDHINAMGHRLVPLEYHGVQPADRYTFEDRHGEIGFVSSVSEPFCSSCNRVRITSDGKLRTCLFSLDETDLKKEMRAGGTDGDLSESIIHAVREKEEGHLINRPGFVRPSRTMSQIGG
jgi:cyclic pyranopterin phosphate synthase